MTDAANTTGEDVRSVLADGVLTLTIDRPSTLNAVDAPILHRLAGQVEAAAEEPACRVVVLRGAGRAFCSGADLAAGHAGEAPDTGTIEAGNRLVSALAEVPRPTVAVVHGPCAGIGVSVALGADLVLARTDAFFLLAFSRIGLMPDGGASALVAASAGRATAMRMALLAERMSGTEAAACGLVAAAFPPEDFETEVAAVVQALRRGPAAAYARTKRAINAATLTELSATFGRELAGQAALLTGGDFAEGVAAFGAKREPRFGDPA